VVRIGTHAVSRGSRTTLWNRLKAHKGTNNLTGNHRGSVFRKLVGSAFINKYDLKVKFPEWGIGSSAKREIRNHEKEMEIEVSNIIGNMSFLVLNVPGESSAYNDRAYIESNAIALLSNHGKDSLDPPSDEWLGYYSSHPDIISSGLWNSRDTRKA
jgi:hypothetical protein